MRICVYKDSLSVGRGADRAVRNFAAALAERGHDAVLVERGGFAAALEERWDALVATGSNEAVDLDRAGYFDRPDRAPVVLQLHLAPRGFFKWKHPLRNRAVRRAFDRVDVAQLLCHDYEREFAAVAPHPRTVTIGNWTDLAGREATPERVILCPAAVVNRVKNQRLLVAAFARVAAAWPDWSVRLLGRAEGRVADGCRKLARRLGVADRVVFAGGVTDMAAEYARAAFVAVPSVLEGFPLAVLEAAAFSRPAVVQRTLPGADEIVRDGETGFVTENSPAAYADALARLMDDAPLRERLGANARREGGSRYARAKIVDDWERLLREVAEKKNV